MNRETAFNMGDQALVNVEMQMRQAEEQVAGLSKELAELDARRFDLQRAIGIFSQTEKALRSVLHQNSKGVEVEPDYSAPRFETFNATSARAGKEGWER